MTSIDSFEQDKETVEALTHSKARIKAELAKVIVGMEEPIEQLLVALFAGGHCLLTGAPGLAKTLLVNTVADVFSLNFSRVQFTPDLMPSDVTGTEILQETDAGRQMKFVKGPIFANMLLADEINRTPPKT
jgi:MoxR-like ATPase